MYSLEELTVAEIKSIDLITQKIKYNDVDDINRVCEYLDNKNRLSTNAGRAYLDALRRMCTGKEEVTECIYCDNTLDENEHIICTDCLRKMLTIKQNKSVENNTDSEKPVVNGKSDIGDIADSNKWKPYLTNKRILVSAIAVVTITLLIAGGLFVKNRVSLSQSDEAEESVALDGIDFIGQRKELSDSIFGSSTPLIMENSIYYPAAGVSVVYDVETSVINYIDCDNNGSAGSIEIMGVNIGWSREELISYFKNMGYDCEIASDNTLTVRTRYNDKDIEIYIVLEADAVILICAYTI